MVDITSLKARLARLRLSSNIAEEAKHDRRLEDPVTAERRKKKKLKKAALDPYNEYTKNTGGKRKKKNKLTRSDQKRNAALGSYKAYHKKQDLVADENKRNTKLQKKKKKKKRAPRVSDTEKSLRERESPGVSQETWDELDQYPELMSDPE